MADDDDVPERDSMDFISSLPDEILHHILSFVPTNLATKTCVLSKRWRHIWREVPCLSLECEVDESSLDFVSQTLFHHTAPKLLSFHICFRFDAAWLEFSSALTGHKFFVVDTWIDYVHSHHPENLSLDLLLYHYPKYIIPDIFYVNSSVKRLTLVLHTYTTLIPRSTVLWPSLKTLCLDGCIIPDESAAKILSGCPLLESLTLNFCKMLGRLDLSESLNLTRLEIDHHNSYSGPTEIVAPHVHYLRLRTTTTTPCRLDDVSSLTQAKLDVSDSSKETMADFIHHVINLNVLPKLHNVEKLTLGSRFLEVLSLAELRGVPFPMLKITSLTLEVEILRFFIPNNDELRGLPGIAKLLQNSPELKKLTLYLKKCKIVNVKEKYTYIDSRGSKIDVFPTSSEPKLIALFIELVLGNTKTIETLVVRLEDNLDADKFEELLQMAQTLPQDHNNVSIVIKDKVKCPANYYKSQLAAFRDGIRVLFG